MPNTASRAARLVARTFGRALLPAILLTSPALAGPAEGQVAWEAGDYNRAVAEWRPAALAGDASAQYGLGQAYLYGRGVATDLKQARLWFEKSAAQSYAPAQDNLGLLLFQEGERAAALPLLERSAARGEPRAQYVLGTAKFNGDLVDRDWVGAYALMTRASAAGLPQASRALAQMDTQIPLAQRQQGQVLARSLEAGGMAVAANTPAGAPFAAPPTATQTEAGPVQRVGVPPSRIDPPAPSVPPVATGTPTPPSRPAAVSRPVVQAPPLPARAATARPADAARPTTGRWRVQLGAFRDRDGANARWQEVRRAVPAVSNLSLTLESAGAVTRVQAGPFATRAEAQQVCRAVTATGRSCFAVRP